MATPTLDEHVRAIVIEAITAERKRIAGLFFEMAQRRRNACGHSDTLVREFTLIANELLDPDR